MDIIRNFVAFIFVIGLLVLIHELGHFTAARANKIKVRQFCIGLGPKLFKYKHKDTVYAICALPIGGMVDLGEDDQDEDSEDSFVNKKPYQRLIVILAGAFMNFVLAYVLIVGVFLTSELPTNVIGELAKDKPAIQAGLLVNDEIISINNTEIKYWTDITRNISNSKENSISVVVLRSGIEKNYTMETSLSDDGRYIIGIGPKFTKDFALSFRYGFEDFKDKSTMIIDGFVKLITNRIDPSQISGPVGIYKQIGEVAETSSLTNLLYFAALLSINLGIFNLLPFPFLDGGRACFIIYEMIIRKPVAKEKEAFVHFLGMVALLVLMVVLVFKDLAA